MAVPITLPSNSYIGTGAANTFAFTFAVFLNTDLLVTVTPASGPVNTLALGTDYTVTGLSATGDPAGTGNIVLVSAGQAWLSGGNLATGYTLTVQSNIPYGQTTSIRNQGDFYRSALENALDRLAIQIQQVQLVVIAIQAGGTITQPSLVITDNSNGHTYKIVTVNGVLGTLQLT